MKRPAFDYSLDFENTDFRRHPELYRVGKRMFLAYLKAQDFPGADMASKFLQMGWTSARRSANHKGGRKYDKTTGDELPRTEDKEKAAAAAIFYERYVAARQHPEYARQKTVHHEKYEAN